MAYIGLRAVGREPKRLTLFRSVQVRRLLEMPFEQVVVLVPYDALWWPDPQRIEARVRTIGPVTNPRLRQFTRPRDEADDRSVPIAPGSEGGPQGFLSRTSRTLDVILRSVGTARLALEFSGVTAATPEKARRFLQSAADGIFFHLDLEAGLLLSLQRGRSTEFRPRKRLSRTDELRLTFPLRGYDSEPMSLYWYGRGARGMPLLEFLAYYQVLEFFFPAFRDRKARQRVAQLLKDPRFDVGKDRDLGKVVEAAGEETRAPEEVQLKATLEACVPIADLVDFLIADEERGAALRKKSSLSNVTLTPKSGDDLVAQLAARVYDIRCKIVHTKGGGPRDGVDLLLPGSPEAGALGYDVELLQFLAQQVLIATSAPFDLS